MESGEQLYLDCGGARESRVQLFDLHAVQYRRG
jgi:hypothetical protein